MKTKQKSVNRKAMPKFLGIMAISLVAGGTLGLMAGFAGASNLPDKIVESINALLTAITPWSILVLSILCIGTGLCLYLTSKKLIKSWDGEDEETPEKAEEKLTWALLASGINMVADLFFFGIGFGVVPIASNALQITLFLSFILSFAGIMILQQKIIDLTRKINPEKQVSVYDSKFHKKWLSSCDENEQRQIGQASYKSFRVVTNTCVILWLVLVVLSFVFKLSALPFFLVTFIFAVSQISYTLECIRLGRHRK